MRKKAEDAKERARHKDVLAVKSSTDMTKINQSMLEEVSGSANGATVSAATQQATSPSSYVYLSSHLFLACNVLPNAWMISGSAGVDDSVLGRIRTQVALLEASVAERQGSQTFAEQLEQDNATEDAEIQAVTVLPDMGTSDCFEKVSAWHR